MKELSRFEIITALKERFPCNNPEFWRKLSDKKLKDYYNEYIEE